MRLGPFRGALARDASTHSDGATMRVGAWAWGKEKDNKLGRKEICINLLGISCRVLILFAIKNLLNGERFWRRPALRAGRRLSTGPPPAFGGRRPHTIPPTRIQKLFASSWY
jgi:hypothetical protein